MPFFLGSPLEMLLFSSVSLFTRLLGTVRLLRTSPMPLPLDASPKPTSTISPFGVDVSVGTGEMSIVEAFSATDADVVVVSVPTLLLDLNFPPCFFFSPALAVVDLLASFAPPPSWIVKTPNSSSLSLNSATSG